MASLTQTISSATDTTLVAAPSGGFIRVWSLSVMSKGGNVVTFKSGGTALYTVLCPTTDIGGLAAAGVREPLFICPTTTSLVVNTTTTDTCQVNVDYSL